MFKDPSAKIRKRIMDKMYAKKKWQTQSGCYRKVEEECDLRLMTFTDQSQKDLIRLVQQRSEYIFAPALNGRRSIVFSKNQTTWTLGTAFQSMLPDGSFNARDRSGVVLDVIYVDNVFWVLDVLLWKDCLLLDCDAEMRSFWLSTNLDSALMHVSQDNEYSFQILPKVDGSFEKWTEIMKDWINNEHFDGILVYHKHSNYLSGETSPLCLKISKDLWKFCEF